LRYLRWGGDGEAVQPEKCSGVENCLKTAQNPQRQVHALLAGFGQDSLIENQNRRHKCLGKLDNQLTRLLHELYSLARTKKL
jgi:hypothetical protein